MIEVSLNNEVGFDISEQTAQRIVHTILQDHGIERGEVSLAIIDDPTMHRLNREHLQHDYPTDVLSFVLEQFDDELEGEVLVSFDTATRTAGEFAWKPQDELMLYFIHGTLHLVGHDDHNDADRAKMREQEIHYLRLAGIEPSAEHLARTGLGIKESSA